MTGRRFHRIMEMIPALPWQSKNPYVSTRIKQSTKQGDARGASEVRRGTSSNHFHCPGTPVVQSYRSPNCYRSLAAPLPSPRGQFWNKQQSPLLAGETRERHFGRHIKRQFGRGQLWIKNCCETVLGLPSLQKCVCEIFGEIWFGIHFEIWNLRWKKSGEIWGEDFSTCQESTGELRGEFRGKFRSKFRKLRFKLRDLYRKLRSAEGRC